MKPLDKSLLVATVAIFCLQFYAQSQILNRVKNRVKQKVEDRAVNRAGEATDKTLDSAEDAVTGDDNSSDVSNGDNNTTVVKNSGNAVPESQTVHSDYTSYDFVPGDKIIFEPDLSSEADAELPARFSVQAGNAEIQSYNDEKILHLNKGGYATISPLMDSDSYLPEKFTVEFDMMYENDKERFERANRFYVQFRKHGDNNYGGYPHYRFVIESNKSCRWGGTNAGVQEFPEPLLKSMTTNNTWHHVAIYIRKNIGKAYIDQYRVAATNIMPLGAGHLDIRTDGRYGIKIKNFRIASGGDDKYDKIVTEGKFITRGILFDAGKSGIKPESMGVLNEIVQLMKDHEGLKFEIDGHTDTDGDEESNLKLSQERAGAVRSQLIQMGIDGSRLTTKGFGESKPIDKNDTSEGKANNRRVEFVKI